MVEGGISDLDAFQYPDLFNLLYFQGLNILDFCLQATHLPASLGNQNVEAANFHLHLIDMEL